ncbi:MAG: ABC transporter permease, partial [Chthoniobacterales bacterium]
ALGTGALAAAFAASWFALKTGPALLGFLAAFLVIIGFAFLVPAATLVAGRLFQAGAGLFPQGTALRLASRNLVRAMHRNSLTVAALMAAIAMTVGVSVMIYSFRASVETWINRTMQADLFLTLAANEQAGFHAELPGELLAWLESHPSTESLDTFYEKRVPFRGEEVYLGIIQGRMRGDLAFTGGNSAEKADRFRQPGHVAVSESFARRHNVKDGDTLPLATPTGTAEFKVAGVYSDYTRDQGVILVDRRNYAAHWPAPGIHTAGVHLRNGTDADAVADELRGKFGAEAEYAIYNNASLRTRILEIFDQTFAITYVLRTSSVLVAIVGVWLGMATLVAEREREIGIMRAVGASARQVWRTFVTEAALVGAVSSAVGLAAGACLAMVLTWVINLAFTGGNSAEKADRFRQPGHVAVSESFARRHNVKDGDTLPLATPKGTAEFTVAGVYSDYTRDQGVILIDRRNYAAHWPAPGVHTAGVHLRKGTDADAVADQLRGKFGAEAEYAIYNNASLRARILEIFDQTFAITYVLRTISVLVAIVGVWLGMATLVAEREREIGIMRAVGASARQVWRTFVTEAAL